MAADVDGDRQTGNMSRRSFNGEAQSCCSAAEALWTDAQLVNLI